MKLYWYQAMTTEGASVRGTGEHADLNDLVHSLSVQGLQPYRVWSLPAWLNALLMRPLSMQRVVEFCHLLAQQVRAGADLRLALSDAAATASTLRLRLLCARLRRALERGDTLANAIAASRAFPAMLGQLVVVGQESGRLGPLLSSAAAQFEQVRQLQAALRRALIYPAMVLLVLLCSGAYWVLVVMPKMVVLFDSLRVQVPDSTRFVIAASDWLRAHGQWLPVLLGLLMLLTLTLLSQAFSRQLVHRLAWWLPGVRRLERSRVYHAFFSHLAAMHGGGLTLNRTLTVLVEQPVNLYFGKRISRILPSAGRGQSLAEGLGATGAFERFALSLVRLGETTGTLDEQSQRLSEHYAQQLKQQIETGSRLFEPVLLLVLGGLLLVVGSTVLGPVYELASRASTGLLK